MIWHSVNAALAMQRNCEKLKGLTVVVITVVLITVVLITVVFITVVVISR